MQSFHVLVVVLVVPSTCPMLVKIEYYDKPALYINVVRILKNHSFSNNSVIDKKNSSNLHTVQHCTNEMRASLLLWRIIRYIEYVLCVKEIFKFIRNYPLRLRV
jgi:hypothetical protein